MKKLKFIICLLYLSFFFLNNLSSEEIPVIVISAGKTAQTLNSVGSSIEIINEDEIQNSNNFSLADIIEENSVNTNLFQAGGYGSNTGIQLRGLEKRYSTIYIDGVKMMDPSSPDGSFYMEHILSNGIESVEILKGTQSSLYGGNAIGGVINIFTKKGDGNDKTYFGVETESNNTKNLEYSINKNFENFNFYLGLNKFSTDGISAMNDNNETDKYNNKSIIGNIQYKLLKNLIFENSFRYANTYYNYDEVLNTRSDLNNNSDNLEFSNSFKIIHEMNKIKNTFSYNKLIIERYTTNYDLSKDNYFGYRDSLNYLGEYKFNLDNKIIFGLDSDFEAARYKVDFKESDKEHDESIISQYFDYQSRLFEKLYFTIGLRNDGHSTAGKTKSGKTSLAYLINNNEKITTSFGAGVRFPTLYDYAYSYETIADKGGTLEELKSERGLSYDLGYNKFFENMNLDLGITYFKTIQKNPILNNARTSWVPRNSTGKNKTEGVELSGKWNSLNNKLNIAFGYSFTDSYDANTCDSDELISYNDNECRIKDSIVANAKVRVPRHSFTTKLNYNYNNIFSNGVSFKYFSDRRDFGNANNNWSDVILKEYSTIDLANYLKLSDQSNLTFGIKNFFNTKYQEAYQYSSPERSLNIGFKTIY